MAMATKASFTPQEWTQILQSVMMTGMAVSAAEPSGLFGMLKEGLATGSALVRAKSDAASNKLVRAVVEDFTTAEGRSTVRDDLKAKLSGGQPGEIKQKALENLRQVAAILDAKAPQDAPAFKAWLRQIGEHVAEAAKEGGGIFGIGGVQVSEAERATLGDIDGALQGRA
jgi:hypothetical protein